jgi:thiosulfate/3-mercaptopyruvate sulfurtransferase
MPSCLRLARLPLRILLFALCLALTANAATFEPPVRSEMLVTTDWLARNLNDPKLVILHVAREREHYEQGHIPGARFLRITDLLTTRDGVAQMMAPVSQLVETLEAAGVGDDVRVVLYGERLGLWAARVWVTLDYLGHAERAALLDGGLERWRAEERPVSTEPVEPRRAQLTPRLRPGVLIALDQMRDASWLAAHAPEAANLVLLDARPEEQYRGENKAERPGHIPGARSLFWQRMLVSAENPVLLPEPELRERLAAAGAVPGQKVITYCHTGIQGSHAYFTARYLGYDVSLYDGSFAEWSTARDTEVARPQP